MPRIEKTTSRTEETAAGHAQGRRPPPAVRGRRRANGPDILDKCLGWGFRPGY